MSVVWLVALALMAAGIVLPAVGRRVGALATTAGCVLAAVVGVAAALGSAAAHVSLGGWLGFGPAALRVDGIAGIFLALAATTAGAVSLRYLERPPSREVTALHGLVVLAVAVVVTVDQAFVFLLAWEALSVALYLIASADRGRPGTLVAAYLAGALNKLSGAALLAGFGLLYGRTGSFEFARMASPRRPDRSDGQDVVFVLLIVGFAAKIGLSRSRPGCPSVYEAAPAPRRRDDRRSRSWPASPGSGAWSSRCSAPAPPGGAKSILVLGALHAPSPGSCTRSRRTTSRRFLGYSTVEHGGITCSASAWRCSASRRTAGVGGRRAARGHLPSASRTRSRRRSCSWPGGSRSAPGLPRPAPAGRARAAASAHRHRSSARVLSLAAIPPFGGFVSEWFTLEALLQGFRLDSTPRPAHDGPCRGDSRPDRGPRPARVREALRRHLPRPRPLGVSAGCASRPPASGDPCSPALRFASERSPRGDPLARPRAPRRARLRPGRHDDLVPARPRSRLRALLRARTDLARPRPRRLRAHRGAPVRVLLRPRCAAPRSGSPGTAPELRVVQYTPAATRTRSASSSGALPLPAARLERTATAGTELVLETQVTRIRGLPLPAAHTRPPPAVRQARRLQSGRLGIYLALHSHRPHRRSRPDPGPATR